MLCLRDQPFTCDLASWNTKKGQHDFGGRITERSPFQFDMDHIKELRKEMTMLIGNLSEMYNRKKMEKKKRQKENSLGKSVKRKLQAQIQEDRTKCARHLLRFEGEADEDTKRLKSEDRTKCARHLLGFDGEADEDAERWQSEDRTKCGPHLLGFESEADENVTLEDMDKDETESSEGGKPKENQTTSKKGADTPDYSKIECMFDSIGFDLSTEMTTIGFKLAARRANKKQVEELTLNGYSALRKMQVQADNDCACLRSLATKRGIYGKFGRPRAKEKEPSKVEPVQVHGPIMMTPPSRKERTRHKKTSVTSRAAGRNLPLCLPCPPQPDCSRLSQSILRAATQPPSQQRPRKPTCQPCTSKPKLAKRTSSKKKSKKYCCFVGCGNNDAQEGIILHRIPKAPKEPPEGASTSR